MKRFPVAFAVTFDFSRFNRYNWTLRSNRLHHQQCDDIKREKTNSRMRKVESQNGLQYSVFLGLPYFDPVCFTAIDVKLGLANMHLKNELQAISLQMSLSAIENIAGSCFVPAGVGRLPLNISSNYRGFKEGASSTSEMHWTKRGIWYTIYGWL